jgi:hypothetical protein
LDPGLEEAAFGLEIRACSVPIYFDEQTVIVIMVSGRDPARKIDDQARKSLKAKALDQWLKGEYPKHKVTFHGFKGGYDSETDAWVQRELLKMSATTGNAGS